MVLDNDKKTNKPSKNGLAERDLKLLQLDEEIKKKKALIVSKKVDLEKKKGLNVYLETVYNDYKKNYEHEIDKKKGELKAMTVLNDYISYLEDENHLINNQVRTAKHDKKEILHEINKIKKDLDTLTNK
jgi:hypothetical protein